MSEILRIMPGPGTPGYELVSPRALKVWISLFHHSQKFGNGYGGHWNLGDLSVGSGCNVNTASSALNELAALGWVKKSQQRHASGTYGGFLYELREPYTSLSEAASAKYLDKIEEQRERLAERERLVTEAAQPITNNCEPSNEDQGNTETVRPDTEDCEPCDQDGAW